MGPKPIASGEMTDDVTTIREHIAETRDEMTATLEQIETRLDPRLLTERAMTTAYDATVGKAKTMVSRTSNGIVDTIKENPVPLALTAIGIGWLVLNARAPHARERVANQATELAHTAREKAHDVETAAKRTFEDNPLAIGLGVVAAGLLIGLAIPTTRRENELLGATRDRLAHQAIGKVDELAHKAIDKAHELAEQPT